MRRFFSPRPLQGPEVTLEGQVVRHLIQVLRMQPGDELELFDGRVCFLARLLEGTKKQARLALLHPLEKQPASPLRTHLGQAISKGDRMDWVVQKATELGVSEITPLYTRQGDVRLKGEREEKKLQHWQQVAISACEQCGRGDLPQIHPPRNLATWLAERQEQRRYLLHPEGFSATAGLQGASPGRVALLVGPEGGLAADEVDLALEQGFTGLTLGPRILRTETAPLVLLSLLQDRWGDLATPDLPTST